MGSSQKSDSIPPAFETSAYPKGHREEYEKIQGTIKWDETLQGALPKIATRSRTYTWLELGQELMSYEGFRIDITIC